MRRLWRSVVGRPPDPFWSVDVLIDNQDRAVWLEQPYERVYELVAEADRIYRPPKSPLKAPDQAARPPVGVKRKLAALLQQKPPAGEQGIILWPRTDQQGQLGSGTQLALNKSVRELDREPGLHALGELLKVDKGNALLQLQIHPNEAQGSLHKPFKLPLVATLELLEGLPELGSGLEVWGELKPCTGRLIVTRAQAVPLPPRRVVAAAAAA